MLKFLIGIICILLHRPKKLTLVGCRSHFFIRFCYTIKPLKKNTGLQSALSPGSIVKNGQKMTMFMGPGKQEGVLPSATSKKKFFVIVMIQRPFKFGNNKVILPFGKTTFLFRPFALEVLDYNIHCTNVVNTLSKT